MEVEILTYEYLKKYTNYTNIIENQEYINLLICSVNHLIHNTLQEKNDHYELNIFHVYFALIVFEYLININTYETNIIELMRRWL